jgi:hypothetical protein
MCRTGKPDDIDRRPCQRLNDVITTLIIYSCPLPLQEPTQFHALGPKRRNKSFNTIPRKRRVHDFSLSTMGLSRGDHETISSQPTDNAIRDFGFDVIA